MGQGNLPVSSGQGRKVVDRGSSTPPRQMPAEGVPPGQGPAEPPKGGSPETPKPSVPGSPLTKGPSVCQICLSPMQVDPQGSPYCPGRKNAPMLHRRLERMIVVWKSGQVVGKVTSNFSQTVVLVRRQIQLAAEGKTAALGGPEEVVAPVPLPPPPLLTPRAAVAPAPPSPMVPRPEEPRLERLDMVLDVGELRQEIVRLTTELRDCQERNRLDRETLTEVLHQLEEMTRRVQELEAELARVKGAGGSSARGGGAPGDP